MVLLDRRHATASEYTYTTQARVTVGLGLLDTVAVSLTRLVVVGVVLRLRPAWLAPIHPSSSRRT